MNVTPCKECERKGCGSYHDQCPEYLAWKAELIAANKRRREENTADSYFRRRRRRS